MNHPNPPKLPAGAVGFLATRHDRPERRALYFPGGGLATSFSQYAPITQIEMDLAKHGFRLGRAIEQQETPNVGGVWEVR